MAEAGSKMKVFSGTVDRSSTSVRRLERSFDTLSNRMSTPLQKLRDYVLILGNIRMAILNVRDIAVGWVGAILKQSAEVERLTMLMKGLSTATTDVGKNTEAEQNLGKLFDMARNTGFAVKELADAFVKMKSAGVDPMDGSLASLTNAVAYFGGTSDTFHRASIAIQQMSGKGVISMEELRQQLGEAVPTAMFDMARAAGMSMKDFTKLVSEGKVQAKPALELMFREFERKYAGAGKRMAETLTGQMAQFKTNLTQLATSFTGMAAGQTSGLRAYIEEQQQLLDDQKISQEEFERRTSGEGGGGGLFAGAKDAMKEINAAMRTGEAQVAVAELGQVINSVLQGLIGVGRFVVEWRHEILGAIKGIAIALTAITAIRLGAWFVQLLKTAGQSLVGILNTSRPLPGVLGRAEAATRNWANATRTSVEAHNAKVVAMGREASMMNTMFLSSQRRIAQLGQERAVLQGRLSMLAQQRAQEMANLQTAQTLHAANIAQGRDTTRSLQNVNAAHMALGKTRRAEMRTNELLIVTERQLAAARQQSTRAAVVATAATSRFTAVAQMSTVAMRAQAAAARLVATAVTFMGRAMSIALGPIGLIAMALYAAADAAGVFESAADRATAAAERMKMGIATLADMQAVQGNLQDLNTEIAEIDEKLTFIGKDSLAGKHLARRRAAAVKAREETLKNIPRGMSGVRNTSVNEKWGALQDQMSAGDQKRAAELAAKVRRIEKDGSLSQTDKNTRIDALNEGYDKKRLAVAQSGLDSLLAEKARVERAGGDTSILDGMIANAKEYRDGMNDAAGSTAELREELVGFGKDTGGATTKLTDTQKAAKKAAKEFESAREKYDKLIDGQKGEIASLEEQLAGGDKKGTAKFEALKQAGFYADATNEELKEMAANFARIDELNEQISFEKSLGSLRKEISQTAAEAASMWKSLDNGTFVADQRDAQYRSRFADLLVGVEDPERLAEINAGIDTAIANIKKADAAEIAHGWIEMAEEIEAGLLSENEARQRNFELEVQRQRDLIALTKEGTDERIKAEAALARWHAARQQQLHRENESGVIKMARDWAKLGTNIDGVFTDATSSLVDMLAEGEVKMGEFAETLIKQLFKVILQAIIAYAILSAIGGTNGQSFSDFMQGGLKNFMGGFAPAQTKHTGGMIGGGGATAMVGAHLWNNAQTRHGGGWIGGRSLRKGEVPIVGMEKELVLTEEQQRLLGQQVSGRGPAGGSAPNMQLNIINNSGVDVDAEASQPEWNGKEFVLSIVMEAANKQGPFRDMLQSQGGKK